MTDPSVIDVSQVSALADEAPAGSAESVGFVLQHNAGVSSLLDNDSCKLDGLGAEGTKIKYTLTAINLETGEANKVNIAKPTNVEGSTGTSLMFCAQERSETRFNVQINSMPTVMGKYEFVHEFRTGESDQKITNFKERVWVVHEEGFATTSETDPTKEGDSEPIETTSRQITDEGEIINLAEDEEPDDVSITEDSTSQDGGPGDIDTGTLVLGLAAVGGAAFLATR